MDEWRGRGAKHMDPDDLDTVPSKVPGELIDVTMDYFHGMDNQMVHTYRALFYAVAMIGANSADKDSFLELASHSFDVVKGAMPEGTEGVEG